MDKKAVNILFNRYWSTNGWKAEREILKEDFEYAKSKKVMFDNMIVDHEKAVNWISEEYNNIKKNHIVKCFVSSLSTRRMDLRSGLVSFAFARNFPKHKFNPNNYNYCTICGLFNYEKHEEDLNILNFERLKWGGVRLTNPIYTAFNLHLLNEELTPEPGLADINILKQIISTIRQCSYSDKPNQLEKKLALVLKSNSHERRGLIDTFGICGILETPHYKGFFDNYIPTNQRSIRPVNKTDWEYPVDWWTGKDGVNVKALNFYFEEYL